jgi:hypothetical protein
MINCFQLAINCFQLSMNWVYPHRKRTSLPIRVHSAASQDATPRGLSPINSVSLGQTPRRCLCLQSFCSGGDGRGWRSGALPPGTAVCYALRTPPDNGVTRCCTVSWCQHPRVGPKKTEPCRSGGRCVEGGIRDHIDQLIPFRHRMDGIQQNQPSRHNAA